jgi:hypothetical protein
VFSDIETPDVRDLGAALTGLASAGLLTPDDGLERWIRDFANLPPADLVTERPAEEEAHEDELYNEGVEEEVINEEPTVGGEEVEDA